MGNVSRACSSLCAIVERRAVSAPDRIGFRFLSRAGTEESLDYTALARRSSAVARRLQMLAPPGARALLLMPPGLDFIIGFFGCLRAGLVAVPCHFPHAGREARRFDLVRCIAADAGVRVVIAPPDLQATLAPSMAATDWPAIEWMTDLSGVDDEWHAWPAVLPTVPAVIQYSSGSTGAPKGIVLTHRNLVANLEAIYTHFDSSAESRGVIWLPPHHDMGLVGGILQPLYGSFPVTLMSPLTFLQQPFVWLKTISDVRATISGGPDFAYGLCVQRITEEQRQVLDLSSWRVAFNGAEPIRSSTLDRFARAFAGSGFSRASFYPCYGLAEATLLVAGADRRCETGGVQSDPEQRVSCGGAVEGHEIRVVDADSGTDCAAGAVGEIWVRGPSVAMGYWNNQAATATTFFGRVGGEGPYLRTGDLGYLRGGKLYVTGRIKDAIVIAGRKYCAQDIELSLEDVDPDLPPGGCAAFGVDIAGQERLAIVWEVARHARPERRSALVDAIRSRVANEWGMPVHAVELLKPAMLPRTTSGKPKRYFCREAYAAGTLPVWSQALGASRQE
jgi:acyl-CoA synthetase (AMP-forming)/AMP-acid ligase II